MAERKYGLADIGMGQVLAMVGAIGIAGLADDIIAWRGFIADAVAGWNFVVRPAMDFLFGWAFDLLGWHYPEWAKDLAGLYFIIAGAHMRLLSYVASDSYGYETVTDIQPLKNMPVLVRALRAVAWPVFIWRDWYLTIDDAERWDLSDPDFRALLIFMSTAVYFALFLSVNYTLLGPA